MWTLAGDTGSGRSALLLYTPIRDDERLVVGVVSLVVDLEDSPPSWAEYLSVGAVKPSSWIPVGVCCCIPTERLCRHVTTLA